ncbi:hypothetical protein [Agrobacterium rosae]|uniref:Uncharacterized protein n=1 Tax=Agrobacterium rosae TaxID=1972867 RepID=A0AAW9FR61_9HYPH|nr:hypothetical protein [Agrobacterium rosae]MDX8305983.1 hypothetical protein [Agrobacterium rosae]
MGTSVSGFISELIRDANQIDRIGDFEKRRMLERAVTTIRDIRETIAIPPSSTVRDVVIDLQTAAALVERKISDDRVKAAMLEAATVLRTLKIVLDARDDTIKGTTQ